MSCPYIIYIYVKSVYYNQDTTIAFKFHDNSDNSDLDTILSSNDRHNTTSRTRPSSPRHDMSVATLLAMASPRTRSNALGALDAFLTLRHVSREEVERAIAKDDTGTALVVLLDKFVLHLALNVGRSGKRLETNMVRRTTAKSRTTCSITMKACGADGTQAQKDHALSRTTLQQARRHVRQTNAAMRKDRLKRSTAELYKRASSPRDYQDAALLNVPWFLFSQSSEAAHLLKSQVSIYPGQKCPVYKDLPVSALTCPCCCRQCSLLRMKRMKTGIVQGVALYNDLSRFAVCPVHSLAVALAVQTTPSTSPLGDAPWLGSTGDGFVDDSGDGS